MTMPNFKWFDSISKRILIWIQIVNSFSEVVKWIMGITVIGMPTVLYMILSVSIITTLIISTFFVVLLLALISLNKENGSLCNRVKNLEAKNKALEEQYNELRKRSCIFLEDCEEFGILNPYLNKDNGYFHNIYDMGDRVGSCKSCSEKHLVLKSLTRAESFSKLESEVNHLLGETDKQSTRVFIDSCKENKEFAQKMHDYLEQNKIRCAQLEDCSNISKFVDKKTVVIVLHWEDPQNSAQSLENTKPWLTERLRSYSKSMVKIECQSSDSRKKHMLDVWLCSNLVDKLEDIPHSIKVRKHITGCLPEQCCDPKELGVTQLKRYSIDFIQISKNRSKY